MNPTIHQERQKLSSKIANLAAICHQKDVSLHILIENLKEQGNAIGSLLFSIPFLLPIPVPGLSCLFGLVIALIGFRMIQGKGPWFPQKYSQRKFSGHLLAKIFHAGEKLLRRIETLTRPRLKIFCLHPWFRVWNGLFIMLCGLILAAPLPPGTNFPPALVILSLSLGTIEDDGLWILIGYILFVLNIIFFSFLSVLGFEGVKLFFSSF